MATLSNALRLNEALKELDEENTIKMCQSFQGQFGNRLLQKTIFLGLSQLVKIHHISLEKFDQFLSDTKYVT